MNYGTPRRPHGRSKVSWGHFRPDARFGLTANGAIPTLRFVLCKTSHTNLRSLAGNDLMDAKEFVRSTITEHPIVLFMKGNAQFPQCGFSGRAVQILKSCGVQNLVTFNVLEDEDVRQAVKDFANWPTVPQLYVNGQFVGGSDIMSEMFDSGELQELLKQVQAA
jgi:monothiol glutaredoxin